MYCILFLMTSCQSKDSLKNVTISPEIYTNRDTTFLRWNFKNNTSKNLIIPTLFTFRRLDGNDHRKYEYKEDYQMGVFRYKHQKKTIVVPYKYLKQIPDFGLDTILQTQIKNLDHISASDYFMKNRYDYIKKPSICPELIFISANSEKQLVFMFKPGVTGKYSIGFLDAKTIERTSILQVGDSLWKKGFVQLKDIVSNRVDGYELEYGEFTLDSVEVNL